MIPATEAPRKTLHVVMNCERSQRSRRDAQMVWNGSKSRGSTVLCCQWLKRQKWRKKQRTRAGVHRVSSRVGRPGPMAGQSPRGVWWATLFITSCFTESTILREVALVPFASWLLVAELPSSFAGIYKHCCFQVGLGTSLWKKLIHYLIWKVY